MTKRPEEAKSEAASLSAVQVAEIPSNSVRKSSQRKLTAKQLMKVRRLKERDEQKAKKQHENELRASYSALTPCKTTLDPGEREPVVGDKLIVRDEYNIKYAAATLLAEFCNAVVMYLLRLSRDALSPGIPPLCSRRQVQRFFCDVDLIFSRNFCRWAMGPQSIAFSFITRAGAAIAGTAGWTLAAGAFERTHYAPASRQYCKAK
jgi:hypothetical protein